MVTTKTHTVECFVVSGIKAGDYEYHTLDVAQTRIGYWAAFAPEDGPYRLLKRTVTRITVTHDEAVEL